MSITSGLFVATTLLTLAVYYSLPRRLQNYWLLIISYVFCISWAWQFALVLLLTTCVNFFMAQGIYQNGRGNKKRLWVAIVFNLFIFSLFRVASFFTPQLTNLLHSFSLGSQLGTLNILLPIGLSFYIVENISYQVDVYQGQIQATKNLGDFALYQAYFPKLLAGPIERADRFLPLLTQQRIVTNETLATSATLISIGVLRKVIIADSLSASIPNEVFTTPTLLSAYELWGWLIVYSFALYNDFAGYTNMVRGISGLFGIELSINFQHPYFSQTFSEFWNRWHITLSHWLRDYIYFPIFRALLRRNRRSKNFFNLFIPPMTTMLVSGLWHGFSWHMLLWGGLHGLYQFVERFLLVYGWTRPPNKRPWWRQFLAQGIIFILVTWAWVPFRTDLEITWQLWGQLLALGTFRLQYRRIVLAAGYLLLSLAIDGVQYYYKDEFIFLRWPRIAQSFSLAMILLLVLILSVGTLAEPFVYQGF